MNEQVANTSEKTIVDAANSLSTSNHGHDRRFEVLALGELLVDFTTRFTPSGAQVTPAGPSMRGDAGGAPANVLAAVARLGGRAGFIGKVGADPFGDFLTRSLEHYGIDTSGLTTTSDTLTTLAFVSLKSDGERSFSFYRNPGADTRLRLDDVNASQLSETRIFHFGSLSMTHEPARSTTLAMARAAKAAGCIVTFDPNWRPPLWQSKEEATLQMQTGVKAADIVKVSEEELELLTGTSDVDSGAEMLLKSGPQLILVTRGEHGCWYHSRFLGSGQVPSVSVRAVDTTGAGDAFMGGFLWRLSQSNSDWTSWSSTELRACILFANAVGALTASKPGTMSAMPSQEEVQRALQNGAF